MTVCVRGVVTDTCVAGTPAQDDALCNGLDEDCDGAVDENYPTTVTSCGQGLCARTGIQACVNGQSADSCVPGGAAASDVVCDGLDEDCDGVVDEDYQGAPSTCVVGGCRATGTWLCVAGAQVNGCLSDPTCIAEAACGDNVDNDNDGVTDCADSDCNGEGPCIAEVCGNSLDDDGDGTEDCADLDCEGHPACGDGVPNPPELSAPSYAAEQNYAIHADNFLGFPVGTLVPAGYARGEQEALRLSRVRSSPPAIRCFCSSVNPARSTKVQRGRVYNAVQDPSHDQLRLVRDLRCFRPRLGSASSWAGGGLELVAQ